VALLWVDVGQLEMLIVTAGVMFSGHLASTSSPPRFYSTRNIPQMISFGLISCRAI